MKWLSKLPEGEFFLLIQGIAAVIVVVVELWIK